MAVLSAVFWSLALALGPFGNFPLGDDWAYASTVRGLVEDGTLRLSPWSAATLVWQAAWGALFGLPFGFSHGALRLSTLVLSWAGALAFHRILERLGARPASAMAGALALLLNPLWFALSFTYMTDVQCVSWMLLSALCLLEGIEEGDGRRLLAGGALCALAYLTRQTGAGMAAGAAAWLAWRGERRPGVYARIVGPLAAAMALHGLWLGAAGPAFAMRWNAEAAWARLAAPAALAPAALARLAGAVLHLGLFLAPWAWCAPAIPGGSTRRAAVWAAAAAALLAACAWTGISPAAGNILGRYGLGTCTMGSSCAFKPAGIFAWPGFWKAVLAVGSLCGVVLAWKLGSRAGRGAPGWGLLACGLSAASVPPLAAVYFFDRYYLPLLPAAIAAAALALQPSAARLAPGLAALAAWSVLGTWDHLAWNSAKQSAGERLHAMGIPREEITNGMDWDAEHGFDRRMGELARAGARPGLYDWWEPSRYRAYVSFAPASRDASLRKAGEAEYFSPLTWRKERLTLWLVRAAGSGGQGRRPPGE